MKTKKRREISVISKTSKRNQESRPNRGNVKKGFLEFCFDYYKNCIFSSNKKHSNKEELLEHYSLLYQATSTKGPIWIIDYPNIIHTLHEKFHNEKQVIKYFYLFLHDQLMVHKATIIIIVKNVNIDNKYNYSMQNVLYTGQKITKKDISLLVTSASSFLFMYEIEYVPKISSSIDDLLGYFITLVLFSFLNAIGENPRRKLTILTNDAQHFDKHLFGKNVNEKTQTVHLFSYLPTSLSKEKVQLVKVHSLKEEKLFRSFLKIYVINQMYDTAELSCFLIGIIDKLNLITKKKNSNTFRFLLTYETFIKKVHKLQSQLCVQPITFSVSSASHYYYYYYLYVLIKCVQATLFENNLFGAVSKKEIVQFFRK